MDVASASSMPFLPVDPQIDVPTASAVLPGDNRSIDQVATNFEGVFLSVLVKEMRQTLQEGGMFGGGDTGDVFGGMFDHYLSQSLAQSGGFGLGKEIKRRLGAGVGT